MMEVIEVAEPLEAWKRYLKLVKTGGNSTQIAVVVAGGANQPILELEIQSRPMVQNASNAERSWHQCNMIHALKCNMQSWRRDGAEETGWRSMPVGSCSHTRG